MQNFADQCQVQRERVDRWSAGLVGALLVLMAALLGRVAQLKLAADPKLEQSVGTVTSSRIEMGRRGDLIDARGRPLATSTVGYRLFVDPTQVQEPLTIAADLANVIGSNPIDIDRKIMDRPGRRYVVIDDLLDDAQVDAVRRANLRGVGLERRLVRQATNASVASMLVGFVGAEHTGLSGFELAFDNELEPIDGRMTYLRDVARQALWIQPSGYQPAIDGESVQLSIDMVIQEIADRHLREAIKKNNAGGGRVVVLDSASGEILALCDVLNPRKGWDEATSDPLRLQNPGLGRNRCVTDPYEPGSTFKPFVWSVATDLGRARLDEMLDTPESVGYRTKSGRLIRDAHYYGRQNWRTVLVKSINAGMAIVAERMTVAEMQSVMTRFGFGTKTNCGIPGESAGIVTSPKDWTIYSQVSVSFGQEVSVTPVQMVRAFSAFARDGTMPALRITPTPPDPPRYQFEHRVLRPEIAMLTREVMRDVMQQGTGRASQSEKYQLFGKSGTAQLPRKDGKGYHQDRYVSSFIAGAPFSSPRIVVLCVIDDPDRRIAHYGGVVAGPVVRDIIDETLGYLGVPAELEADPSHLAVAR